jgi:hypothetical protein
VLVFYDGRFPVKSSIDKQRQQRRMAALASMLYDSGKHYHVVATVAHKLGLPATIECLKALHLMGFPSVVDPYEASPHLADNAKNGTKWAVYGNGQRLHISSRASDNFQSVLENWAVLSLNYNKIMLPQSWAQSPEYNTPFLRAISRFVKDNVLAYAQRL